MAKMMNLFKQDLSLVVRLRRLFSRSTREVSVWHQRQVFPSPNPRSHRLQQMMGLLFLLAAPTVAFLLPPSPARAQLTRNFDTYPSGEVFRFQTTTIGDIYNLGNTLMTCVDPPLLNAVGCATPQSAPTGSTPPTENNRNYNMVFVNTAPAVAGPAPRDNSSSITVNLPAGSTVVFAGLYWGAFVGENNDGGGVCPVSPSLPCAGVTPVQTVNYEAGGTIRLNQTADEFEVNRIELTPGRPYIAFLDVTTDVQTANVNTGGGPFQFAVGGIEAAEGPNNNNANADDNNNAGWALVLVFANPNLPAPIDQPRTLSVYDGMATATENPAGVNTITFNVTGFDTPDTGPVLTEAGFINYEGDAGITTLSSDIQINTTTLDFPPLNPGDDFVNSTISRFGLTDDPLLARNPNFRNQLGFDIDTVRFATSPIGNNVQSATVTIRTRRPGESFSAGVFTLAISSDLPPNLRLVKRITNITRGGVSLSGVDFGAVVDDPDDDDDNAAGFSQIPLVGLLSLGADTPLQSGDEIEYTIYFLSDGQGPAQDVQFCDPIPDGTTFASDSFGGDIGIQVNQAGTVTTRTNASDTDSGTFSSALAPLPTGNSCPNQTNANGAVTVDLGNILADTGANFGFVRFRTQVN